MRKYLIIGWLIIASALTASAQAEKNNKVINKPNLTGSWLLDRKRSNVGGPSKPNSQADLPLKITHRDPELRITRLYDHNGQIVERETFYYSDGRGETNPATMILSTQASVPARDLEKQTTKSKTRWSGKKLVTSSIVRDSVAGHPLEFEIMDEWKLSEDGKTLTQTSHTIFRSGPSNAVFVPSDAPDLKRVYNRLIN
ncbi:MAG: hypothetical protein ABJC10_08700 [Acidobacteriota bacterium]